MPRPQTKKDLLELSTINYAKLTDFIERLPVDEQLLEFPEGTMNRNIGDVLAHLHHWHLMMKDWYEVGMRGDTPDIPAKGYNWRTIPALNREIWEKYKEADYFETKENFKATHAEMIALIEKHTNDELFERKRYAWTGNNAMGAYFIGVLSSHYDWALKLIKKAIKNRKMELVA